MLLALTVHKDTLGCKSKRKIRRLCGIWPQDEMASLGDRTLSLGDLGICCSRLLPFLCLNKFHHHCCQQSSHGHTPRKDFHCEQLSDHYSHRGQCDRNQHFTPDAKRQVKSLFEHLYLTHIELPHANSQHWGYGSERCNQALSLAVHIVTRADNRQASLICSALDR